MTLDKIIEQIHKNICEPVVLPKSKLDLSIINKFKYIDVMEFYYDDKEHPDDNTWIDIEGIGYGWIWTGNKIRSHSKFLQRKAIREYAFYLLSLLKNNDHIITFDHDEIYYFKFVYKDEVIQIRVSNKILYFV